jgi:acetate kinase
MEKHECVLCLNGGSSSLKFALYQGDEKNCVGRGSITGIGTNPVLTVKGPIFGDMKPELGHCNSTTDAAGVVARLLQSVMPENALIGIGHRVLHGQDMTEPTIVRPYVLAYLKTLIPLAPLHQPFNIEGIEMMMKMYPKVPQVACFDTAFHTTIAPLHTRFAIPRIWHDKGVRRYGFHGLSYDYIASRLKDVAPKAYAGKTIVAHLGSGASLCAIEGGKSFASTMGFSVLDGLIMGTRPGVLDPGVMLYFMREAKLDEKAIERMLYHDSGLRGVSGISNDMAVLLASKEPEAREAIDLFCLRVTRELGGLVSVMGGINSMVFTGGLGENAVSVRAQIAESLRWLGIDLDLQKNANPGKGEILISSPSSKIDVWLIPTDEESVIARYTRDLVETYVKEVEAGHEARRKIHATKETVM